MIATSRAPTGLREEPNKGLDRVLEENKRDLSLVDTTSFQIMRRERIDRAFAFDQHFTDAGFEELR